MIKNVEGTMLSGFGIYGGAMGAVMCVWFIHVGFLVKKLFKEQQETNRLLCQMGPSGSGLKIVSKAT
jgi:hypothetical protein